MEFTGNFLCASILERHSLIGFLRGIASAWLLERHSLNLTSVGNFCQHTIIGARLVSKARISALSLQVPLLHSLSTSAPGTSCLMSSSQ